MVHDKIFVLGLDKGTTVARGELRSMSAPTNGLVSNTAVVEFPESTSAWTTGNEKLTHYVIFDAATGGNLLMYGDLTSSRTVEANTIMMFKVGELRLSVVNPS